MKKVERFLLASLGMTLINVGVAFIALARIGEDSLTLLMQALYNNFGRTLGTWSTILGIIFVAIALFCDRKKIGYSTLFYVITSKYIIDGVMYILPVSTSYIMDAVYCVAGIIVITLGSALGICARLGLSYYDAFCFSVSERFKLKYVYFRYTVEAIFIIISLFLHTYPGIGTIIYFVVLGPCVTFALKLIKAPIRKHLGLEVEN